MKRILLIGLVLAGGCFAMEGTAPQATMIGPHRLGENVSEWLAASRMDLAAICQNRKTKALCKSIAAFQNGTSGQVNSEGIVGQPSIHWHFEHGAMVWVEFSYLDATEEQIRFLTETYGKPSSSKVVPWQNDYGAHWDCAELSWNLPDGALIYAYETVGGTYHFRSFSVNFLHPSQLDRALPKANPYSIAPAR